MILRLFLLAATATAWIFPAWAAADGAVLYKRCSACHLQTGQGVPGAFPPLDAHVAGFAATAAGRDYLTMVITAGVTGEIKVNGRSYRGFMSAQPMKDEDAAAVLNYVLTEIVKPQATSAAFTPEEVADIRNRHKGIKASDVLKLRPLTAPQNGDKKTK